MVLTDEVGDTANLCGHPREVFSEGLPVEVVEPVVLAVVLTAVGLRRVLVWGAEMVLREQLPQPLPGDYAPGRRVLSHLEAKLAAKPTGLTSLFVTAPVRVNTMSP